MSERLSEAFRVSECVLFLRLRLCDFALNSPLTRIGGVEGSMTAFVNRFGIGVGVSNGGPKLSVVEGEFLAGYLMFGL